MSLTSSVISALQTQFPDARVLTSTTGDFQTDTRQIRVVALGGPQKKNLNSAHFIVETFCYAPEANGAEPLALALAGQVNDFLAYTLRGVVGDSVITTISVDQTPATSPYTNTNVSQQVGRYTILSRPKY